MNPPAGFWRRYAAYSLDATAIGLLCLPLLWSRLVLASNLFLDASNRLLDRVWPMLDAASSGAGVVPSDWLDLARDPALLDITRQLAVELAPLLLQGTGVVMAVAAPWFIASESSRWQASPGKRLLGLRVTDVHGERCGRGRIALRFVAGLPSWLLLNLGHAMAGVTPGKRALHDYLAGTRVELAPGAPAALPRAARSWLLLQVAVFFGLVGFVVLRYLQLLVEITLGSY
ncbi:MAG: RDD family protein [Arenimonas sp.]|uniref:RDD family protein n=1 Tax=Arenimonas sp. TaxID=1872635 RepID=UPI0025BA8A04|nr:RDD family protein [Arenimonas sp.]MBW8368860.1 RDD family protein [Arenimonas sp.]